MAERVIITGGTGFIGQALVSDLHASGYEVVVLSRTPARRPNGIPTAVQVVGWDGLTAASWGHLADGAYAIVNLAGASLAGGRWTAARKTVIASSRVNSGRAIVAAVEQAQSKPRVVVQQSGIGYYGVRGDEEVDEGLPPGDDFLARVCVDWEASSAPVEQLGVRRVVLRSGVVLAPHGGSMKPMLVPFRFGLGGRLGHGRQWLPWLHLTDKVRVIRHAIETDVAGAYNSTSPGPVTNARFTTALGRALGRPTPWVVPAFVLRLVLGEMSMLLLEGQRAVPARLVDRGFDFRFPSIEMALADLF